MGFLKRAGSKSERHDFIILVERLTPWPTLHGDLVVQWHRGSKRGGSTIVSHPDNEQPGGTAQYTFDDSLHVPATLYTAPDGYQSKTLVFSISQVDEKGRPMSVLGTAAIDLSELAQFTEPIQVSIPIECSQAIRKSAGGQPLLTVTMGSSATSGGTPKAMAHTSVTVSSASKGNTLGGGNDEEPSQSITLTLPSRLSTETESSTVQNSNHRLKPPPLAEDELFDEDGFLVEDDDDAHNVDNSVVEEMSEPGSTKRNLNFGGSSAAGTPVSPTNTNTPPANTDDATAAPASGRRFTHPGTIKSRKWAWRKSSEDSGGGVSVEGSSSPKSPLARFKSSNKPTTLGGKNDDGSPRGSATTPRLITGTAANKSSSPLVQKNTTTDTADPATTELKMLAALEASVYFAGTGPHSPRLSPSDLEVQQAPARRLARTIIMLGPTSGVEFAMRALESIKTAAGGASAYDVQKLISWWSNILTLRWSFWALNQTSANTPIAVVADSAAAVTGSNQFSWATDGVLPACRELEAWLFDQIVAFCWKSVLLHTAKESAVKADEGHVKDKGPEEHAVRAVAHWVQGLAAVDEALTDTKGRPSPAPKSHIILLRSQVLLYLLGRIDAVLFSKLVRSSSSSSSGGDGAHRHHHHHKAAANNTAAHDVDTKDLNPRLLLSLRSSLTFTSGVAIKMAVGRFTEWALDANLKTTSINSGSFNTTNGSSNDSIDVTVLFPLLRSTADVLMMPKENLLDVEIRKELTPGLGLISLQKVLERYKPDEFAPEALPIGLLQRIKTEAATSKHDGAEIVSVQEYQFPSDTVLLAQGLVQPLNLAMSDESDDELGALEAQWSGSSSNRYTLLRELWQGARLVPF